MSTGIDIKKKLAILEEGANITTDATSIDFVGSGVNSSSVGGNVTVTIDGGVGAITYYLNETVTQSPYKEFSSIVTGAAEQLVPLTVAGGVTSVIAEYQTPVGVPGSTQIVAGLWSLYLHFNAAVAGQNWIIRPTVYKRDLGGIETLVFTSDPVVVTNMPTVTTMYLSDGVFPATTLLTSDRLVVRLSMENTTVVSQTVTFRTEGSQHYSVATTTLNPTYNPSAVLNVTGTAPIVSSGGTTPAISIPQATAIADGYLSSSDFAVFNAKVPATRNITINGNTQDLSADRTWTVATSIPQTNTIYVDSVLGVNAATGRGDINTPYLTPEYALANINNTGTVTATTTSTSATLTVVSDTTNIKVGQYITGTGIPYASQVVSKTSNTIVLSKTCTASATITATWWTVYEVMLIGNFVATSNFHKTGFNINAKIYNASITFGNLVLFTLTVSAIIPVNISLGNTYCNHISGGLLQGGCIGVELDYGNYYSIGTGFQIGSPVGSSTFSCTNFIASGIMFDCRFGAATFINAGTFQWYGECYGLTGGIRVGSTKSEVNGIITCPTSVSAILVGGESNIYGSVTGNVTLTAGTYAPINVYANINGTTITLGSGNIENITIHGNITGNISNLSPLRILGVVNGNITNNGGSVGETVCIGKITGTVTCTTGTFLYLAQQTGTHSSNSMSGVIIGNGNFVNSGGINLNTITYTGTGTFTNNGKINCFVAANNAPSYTLSSGGTFINNGTIESTSDCAAIFDKSASSTFVNNGVMINPLGMYIRYLTNSSPSRDLIIGNSICDGNLYAKPSAGCGTVNKFSVILANTNTSVDIFDGTNTVTISVVGAGKTTAVISAEIVTLIKASILKFQGTTYLSAYGLTVYVPLTGVTPTFTNLVNINSVGTLAGGGGFSATVLASGTELASSYYSNF